MSSRARASRTFRDSSKGQEFVGSECIAANACAIARLRVENSKHVGSAHSGRHRNESFFAHLGLPFSRQNTQHVENCQMHSKSRRYSALPGAGGPLVSRPASPLRTKGVTPPHCGRYAGTLWGEGRRLLLA